MSALIHCVTVESDDLAALPRVRRSALEQALRRVEGAPAVDPLTVALAVLDALRQLADASPVLIAVDDLQWLDAPSLRAVTSAFRRLDDAPVGLVATIRSAFADDGQGLALLDGAGMTNLHHESTMLGAARKVVELAAAETEKN